MFHKKGKSERMGEQEWAQRGSKPSGVRGRGTGRDWMLSTTEAGDLPPPHSCALLGAKGNYAFSQAVRGTALRFWCRFNTGPSWDIQEDRDSEDHLAHPSRHQARAGSLRACWINGSYLHFYCEYDRKEYGTDFKTLGDAAIKKGLKFYGLQVILGNVANTYLHPAWGREVMGPLRDFSLGRPQSFHPHIRYFTDVFCVLLKLGKKINGFWGIGYS